MTGMSGVTWDNGDVMEWQERDGRKGMKWI